MREVRLSEIAPQEFAHEDDIKTSEILSDIPFLTSLLRLIDKHGFEKIERANRLYGSVQVTAMQFPTIWNLVHQVSEILGMPTPRVYLARFLQPNASAHGTAEYSIVLSVELVDLVTDRELEAIIAHELAHILCDHMLYREVAYCLAGDAGSYFSGLIPSSFIDAVVMRKFYSWYRAAEYSADRAAALVLGDPEPLASCLGKIAGVPDRFRGEFSLELFAEQVPLHKEESSFWSKFMDLGVTAFRDHPEPARRVAAVYDWVESDHYREILAGRYLTRSEVQAQKRRFRIAGLEECSGCFTPMREQQEFCPECNLPADPSLQQICSRGHINATTWRYCKTCGECLLEE